MKSSALVAGHDYAVIPSWEYSSQNKKDPMRVNKNDVAKAKLVSLKKYEYKVYRADNPNDPEFVPAQQGSRTVGYLVSSDNWSSNGYAIVYWLARPQDIVDMWSVLEPRWQQEEILQKQEEERQRIAMQKREEERKAGEEKRNRYEHSTRETLRALLGNRVTDRSVRFNLSYDFDLTNGTVELSTDLVSALIEKVLEAKDLVG